MLWKLLLVCVAALVIAGTFVRRLRRWFLVSGCLGLLIAFALVALPHGLLSKRSLLAVLYRRDATARGAAILTVG